MKEIVPFKPTPNRPQHIYGMFLYASEKMLARGNRIDVSRKETQLQ